VGDLHLDCLGCSYTAHDCTQQTDRQTDTLCYNVTCNKACKPCT